MSCWVMSRWIMMLGGLLLLYGCSTSVPIPEEPNPVQSLPANSPSVPSALADNRAAISQMLREQHRRWEGTPYRLGGKDKRGIDCSAFVQRTFLDRFAIRLPRTTAQQQYRGTAIGRANLQAGDLVFFRTSRKVRHVGIYIGDQRFVHASTSRGVTLSRLDNPYWRKHYWMSRRIIH